MTRAPLVLGCAALLVAAECVAYGQAAPILQLLVGSRVRALEPARPTDVEICEAIAAEYRRRKQTLVAASFEPEFLPPRRGTTTPRVDAGRLGMHVHALRIAEHGSMDASVLYELGTAVHNVVLRQVDAHWEVTVAQEVAYEQHAEVRGPRLDGHAAFDDAILATHVPRAGTRC